MTIDTFNQTRWGAKMKAIYDGKTYDIASVDFQEQLVGIHENLDHDNPDEVSWKRCENIELDPTTTFN